MKCCNSGRKCWNSAFNAQGLRVFIVVVQVGAVKIYVWQQEWRRSRKRKCRMKLSLPPKLMVFWVWPPLNASVLFCMFFFNLTLCMTKLRVVVLCLSYFTDKTLLCRQELAAQCTNYVLAWNRQDTTHSQLITLWTNHNLNF